MVMYRLIIHLRNEVSVLYHWKKNWVLIDTIAGAEASAISYSIAETAKANNLRTYEYYKYLLTEIPKYQDETDLAVFDQLLPWSASLPEYIRRKK
ncbi:protein of unknown function [Petrocella atlantisensis]|uniref:Transposase IS66 C-terminal domain-containing protein n=2 Tax=Petrocella atlantisensis TaxID=2173034 RepID=A0A3P7PVH5_9FIRM|nr:protein of unknown function [Petrocella atlantisensis]